MVEFRLNGDEAAHMMPLGLDWTDVEAELFEALIATARVEPASAGLRTAYVSVVAPEILTQLEPLLLHLYHWYLYDVGAPVQLPVDAPITPPYCGMPVTTGAAVFAGIPVGVVEAAEQPGTALQTFRRPPVAT